MNEVSPTSFFDYIVIWGIEVQTSPELCASASRVADRFSFDLMASVARSETNDPHRRKIEINKTFMIVQAFNERK